MLNLKSALHGIAFFALIGSFCLMPLNQAVAQDTKKEPPVIQKAQDTTRYNSPLSVEDKEKIKTLRSQHREKSKQLNELFKASSFNEAEAQKTFDEVQKINSEIAQIQFKATVAHKKANPNWQPPTRKKNKKAKKNNAN
ncbi:hypothetical protein [Desulfovibrio litoralis]|uniref:LTXXQ motif family protein n=1 Tax=Desulfovibrio litoralis DSM 11393 TaxID=1121455 RepID=A0A1M7RUP7_9BACT|nr:hypothetical protein [Desulfovibrio litoralis]SHN49983.1 hypothetical protein SAMN02745728_00192 [Desulfovibrio litoralis DSM 11393]